MELKDNLKDYIEYKGEKYYSIIDVLKAYYYDKSGNYKAMYRGIFIYLNFEDINTSLYSALFNQITNINTLYTGKKLF